MRFKRKLIAVLTLVMCWMACGFTPASALPSSYKMPYYITVDISSQIVTIYNSSDGTIARQMLCSTGMNDCTPTGVFYLPTKKYDQDRQEWYFFNAYNCYAKYATRIRNGYMFHSITFNRKSDSSMNKAAAQAFGRPASHGCIRLRVDDAEFIAKECMVGTYCKIFKSGERDDDLRAILAVSSFTGAHGMTYQEFMGVSEGDLGRGSEGGEVKNLQTRLTDLGYYDGTCGGTYDVTTIAAVKRLQKDLGLSQNGVASAELLEIIYSDDAPVSTGLVTLKEGNSGPIVQKLQTALQELGLYQGDIDSVYDVDVTEAIKLFQSAYSYKVDGIASPELQQAVYYEQAQLLSTFGDVSAVTPDVHVETVTMATVQAKARVIIREKPDTTSAELGKVSNGDTVLVLQNGGEWSQIVANAKTGYMRTKYLNGYTQDNLVLLYSSTTTEANYQIGHTVEEYFNGASTYASIFSEYYASEQYESSDAGLVDYATVATESDSVMLNLRADPSADGEVLTQVPNGTMLRVLTALDGWTRVSYEDKIGYLLNDYLTFSQGAPMTETSDGSLNVQGLNTAQDTAEQDAQLAADIAASADNVETIYALVLVTDNSGKAIVYDSGSDDGKVIGSLPAGTKVKVVVASEDDNWVYIEYKGRQGYMNDVNLQFQLSDDM